jgi:hypothetical protein
LNCTFGLSDPQQAGIAIGDAFSLQHKHCEYSLDDAYGHNLLDRTLDLRAEM